MHEHIGPFSEFSENRLTLELFEIDDDGALVAVVVQECDPQVVSSTRPDRAEHVSARRLDLDHVRAQVSQQLRRVGTECDRREIDDL